jgi:phosphatidylinositol alpha-1,6-mannosyltransferase
MTTARPRVAAVLLAHDFYPTEGGIQTFMRSIVESDTRFAWTVLTRHSPGDTTQDEALAVSRTTMRPGMRLVDQAWIRMRRARFTVADLIAFQTEKKLLAIARTVSADFLFADQYWTALAVERVAVQLGVPWGFAVHGKELLVDAPQRDRLLRAADLVVATSCFSKTLAVDRGAREEAAAVIHPAVDLRVFNTRVDREMAKATIGLAGSHVLLTVAHLIPRKGHAVVLHALPSILARYPQTVYAIVGRGPQEDALRRLAGELGLGHAVRFLGYVASADLPDYYRAADIYLMPSQTDHDVEGFGISFIEAAACGTPSIGSHSGGIPEAVVDGVTGCLVEPDNVAGLAEAVVRLLGDDRQRRALGQAASDRAAQQFDRDSIHQAMANALARLDRRHDRHHAAS